MFVPFDGLRIVKGEKDRVNCAELVSFFFFFFFLGVLCLSFFCSFDPSSFREILVDPFDDETVKR